MKECAYINVIFNSSSVFETKHRYFLNKIVVNEFLWPTFFSCCFVLFFFSNGKCKSENIQITMDIA